MKPVQWLPAALLVVMGSAFSTAVWSEDEQDEDEYRSQQSGVQPYFEYHKHIEMAQNIAPLDTGLFGEQVSLYNGSTEFRVVDIDIPGNHSLPVQLIRSHLAQVQLQGTWASNELLGGLGNWNVDVPYMAATYSDVGEDATYSDLDSWSNNRCSSPSSNVPPLFQGPFSVFYRAEVWQGITVHIPGRSDVMALGMHTQTPRPSSGGPYQLTTAKRDMLDCIPMQGGLSGEGFRMTTTEGVRYYFDIGTTRQAASLEETRWGSGGSILHFLHRTRYFLLASKIEDRFGNWVQFEYNSEGHPTRIWSNDDREIILAYSSGRLVSATSSGRTWHYQYQPIGGRHQLVTVTRPDNSQWQYAYNRDLFPSVSDFLPHPPLTQGCNQVGFPMEINYTLTATHPSGATGVFTLNNRRHYRSGVHVDECSLHHMGTGTHKLLVPYYFETLSLESKTISGPGLSQAMEWQYNYEQTPQQLWGSANQPYTYPCGNCPLHKTVTVTNPDLSQQRYRFGILYQANDGRQLQVETLSADGTVLRKEVNEFIADADVPQQPFYGAYGSVLGHVVDPLTARVRPIVNRTITQQNTDFHFSVNEFDYLARAVDVTRSSSQGQSRVEQIKYHDNLNRWVLGQTKTRTATGLKNGVEVTAIVESTTYSPDLALPLSTRHFDKIVQELSWNTTASIASGQRGTVSTVTDGGGNTTTLSNWKRGIPQSIIYADSTSTSSLVNDDATLVWAVDENGYKTCYDYDAMGRLEAITWPSESQTNTCDTSAWNKTTQSFVQSTTGAYGLPAYHWRQTIATGNARHTTYFDALWRPVLVHEYDTAYLSDTQRFTRYAYDHESRPIFTSKLSPNSSANIGIHITYDALGRITEERLDSELGPLITTIEYLQNFIGYYTQVTDPRGYVTQTWYQAFDEPNYQDALAIGHPENIATVFARDFLGQVDWMARQSYTQVSLAASDWRQWLSGSQSQQLRRSYVYNNHRELCKIIEPESGATIMAYNDAGQLEWSVSGSSLTDTQSCNTANVPVNQRTIRQYDTRNRLQSVAFPDGLGNTSYSYTADGLPETITTQNGAGPTVSTSYMYNHRRLLTHEHQQQGGNLRTLVTAYDANGHVSAHTYPVGGTVSYAPNAFGQPTQVGNLITNVKYHPDGMVQSYTYGNGIAYTKNQNMRALPSANNHAFGGTQYLADNISYDQNGNVKDIIDSATAGQSSRTMAYDGMNRLRTVISPMFGSASYHYDVFDNLTRVCVSDGLHSRQHSYHYDENTQRLTSISTAPICPAGDDALFKSRFELQHSIASTHINLSYDARGNLINRNSASYSFDYGNRLRSVTGSPGNSQYSYDGHGRRIRDSVDNGHKDSFYTDDGQLRYTDDQRQGTRNNYYYLNNRLIAVREYSPGNQLTGTRYYHTDALGSPVMVTNQSRTILERREYEPYGAQLSPSPDDGPGYTGHVFDSTTGLNYMQQRYYDPLIGRFLSVDPVTPDPDTGSSFNRYWYAANNPYRYIDPDGRSEVDFIQREPEDQPFFFDGGYVSSGVIEQSMAQHPQIWGDPAIGEANRKALIGIGIAADLAIPLPPLFTMARVTRGASASRADVTRRPSSFRKQTVQDAWDNATPGSRPGTRSCPTCARDVEVRPGQGRRDWDVDHQPKWRDRDLSGMDRRQVLDEYNRGVRLRCPSCNRSDN